MINELIEQIGGRERLAKLVAQYDEEGCCDVQDDEVIAALRALLAVLDAKPAGYVRAGAFDRMKDGRPAMIAYYPLSPDDVKLYTIVPAASFPDGFKLAPIEPSKEMLLASKRYKAKNKVPTGPGVYRAMIAAVPVPGGEK